MPVSVVPHRAHVVASPQRRPLRPRPRLACKPMASAPPFARAAHSAMAHLLDRCGTPRPTDRDFHAAGGAFRHADARGLFTAWRSAYDNGVSSRSLRRLPPADRDVHAAGGALRHTDARGLFTAWRSSYYNNGVSARSMRHLPPSDRAFHSAGSAFRHADARGLFTVWRSAYYNGVWSRSLRHPSAADRDVHAVGGAPWQPNARGGFRPAQRGTHAPSFFPHMRRTGG